MKPGFNELDIASRECGSCGIWDECMGDEKKLENMYNDREGRQIDRILSNIKKEEWDMDCWRPIGALLVWEEIEV